MSESVCVTYVVWEDCDGFRHIDILHDGTWAVPANYRAYVNVCTTVGDPALVWWSIRKQQEHVAEFNRRRLPSRVGVW